MKLPSAILLLIFSAGLAIHPSTLHAADLTTSVAGPSDYFGISVSLSGTNGLVGADGSSLLRGSAYVFRNLDTASGTVTENVKLTASDSAANDVFGFSVSLSGTNGLVGADGANSYKGSAYVFRNLDTASGTVTQNVKLTASDGAAGDYFGNSVSLSGTTGLVGAYFDTVGSKNSQGSAYVFRNLDTAPSAVFQNVKLTASDGNYFDHFGSSVSLSGTTGLVGAFGSNSNQGSAYVFRNLDTASGTVTQNVKLTASDGAANDNFGFSVSLSGTIGLVGASGSNSQQGSAYVFRNLNTASFFAFQNVKLIASDGAASDNFGRSVSLSGTTGLVGAYNNTIGSNLGQGSAYVFRNLDMASGTVTQNVKLFASDGTTGAGFGISVGLDGDNFLIGAYNGNNNRGEAYTGSVSSITTLDSGNTSKTISGISFVSQDNWIIGQTTSGNQVTLGAGDSGNVTASGKGVYIGQNVGSNNNKLTINGGLAATQITVGTVGNTGNILQIGNGGTTGTLASGSTITNNGIVIFNHSNTITQGLQFGSAGISGTGSVTQSGSGTTVLNAANNYSGGTLLNAGIVKISSSNNIGTGAITFNGGLLETTQTMSLANNIVVNDPTHGVVVDTGTLFLNGAVSGSYVLHKDGAGTLVFGGSNNTTPTVVNSGTVQGNASNAGTSVNLTSSSSTFAFVQPTQGTYGGPISGAGGISVSGAGGLVLTGSNTYTGATSVTQGKLVVDGSIASSSGVSLDSGTTLGGHGTVSTITGSGIVAPGNSPGILTAVLVDPGTGLDFAFQFTSLGSPNYNPAGPSYNSLNDVLHLTGSTPFSSLNLTAANNVLLDFTGASHQAGDVYRGGFYTDLGGDFYTTILNANFTYAGLSFGQGVNVSTVQQNANFGAGTINGYVTQFTITGAAAVPEPGRTTLIVVGIASLLLRRKRSGQL